MQMTDRSVRVRGESAGPALESTRPVQAQR